MLKLRFYQAPFLQFYLQAEFFGQEFANRAFLRKQIRLKVRKLGKIVDYKFQTTKQFSKLITIWSFRAIKDKTYLMN